jgi:hypothetical protein
MCVANSARLVLHDLVSLIFVQENKLRKLFIMQFFSASSYVLSFSLKYSHHHLHPQCVFFSTTDPPFEPVHSGMQSYDFYNLYVFR